MPIQTGDIRLLESDTMSDAPEGGGAMTGNVIIDGQSNNIFEDISTLDRVYGAVHMRKIFPAIHIQTQDKYFGAHAILSKLPKDEKIGVNLFNTENWFDRRPAAQTRVENYRAKGGNYNGFLWATQWKDSKVITIFQNSTASIPSIGDVLYLTQASDTETQFVKITKLESSEQEFSDANGVYKRIILNIEISQALEYDFQGSEMSRTDSISPEATIKTTVVANAAKYYSARPLALPGSATDLEVNVDSVYSQVIPSSLQELAMLDENAGVDTTQYIDSAAGTVSFLFTNNFAANVTVYMGGPCLPGSLSIPVSGGTIVDFGGELKINSAVIGTIDYAEGTFTFSSTAPTYTGTKTVTYLPAAAPLKIADTATLAVTDSNRGYVWTINISPPPEPGSLQISYMALGEWYDLFDNGSGGIKGSEDGIGSGSVSYVTGSVAITLAALPDVGSDIVFSWGQKVNYYNRSDIVPDAPVYTYQLTEPGVARGTLVITWNDGTARTATADNFGVITGDATGTVVHSTGVVKFSPNLLPLGGTTFTMDYQYGDPLSQNFAHPLREGNGELLIDLNVNNLLPNSIEVEWNVVIHQQAYKTTIEIIPEPVDPLIIRDDDGAGAVIGVAGSVVDYVNGTVRWNPDVTATIPKPTYNTVLIGSRPQLDANGDRTGNTINTYRYVFDSLIYIQDAATYPDDESGSVTIRYRVTDSEQVAQDIFTANSLDLDITPQYAEKIVPGCMRFALGGEIYIDRLGSLYIDMDHTNGAAVYAGTIDYTTGNINITNWQQGASNTLTLSSLATGIAASPVDDITFRVPNAPVKTESLSVRVTPLEGGEISATSDPNGFIKTADMDGFIVYSTGVVSIRFGEWVAPAGYEGEDWYDAEAIIDGMIFKPKLVHADTLLYNAVSQTFLPLDADILGLNPVRLPQDGRIPVYADGDVVVILHDQVTMGTYANSEVLDLGRGRLAKLSVRDSANQELLETRYTADLDTGIITFNDLTGVSQPLTLTDRIEDMSVLTDVQITGKLALSQPLTHDFPADETIVSNAVIYGDLYATTSIPFDQQTWTGEWTDILIGGEVAAQFNHSQYPIVVDNASCIKERWAFIFTSSTTVNVIGENVGQILTNATINADIAPINPNTLEPYFTIPTEGWGSGWSAGNVLRVNTRAANAPVWIIQSVAQGEATDTDYNFCVEVRGDIDTIG